MRVRCCPLRSVIKSDARFGKAFGPVSRMQTAGGTDGKSQ